MNKLLILSVLQLGVTGAILFVLLHGDSRLPGQEPERPATVRPETMHKVRSDASDPTVDAESIRQIVRSELLEFSAQLSGPATSKQGIANDIDPLASDVQLSEARKRMEVYLAVGEITDREIDEFQIEISTLDQATQRAMLSELFREINAGNVKISN